MGNLPIGRFGRHRGFRPGWIQTLAFLALLPALLGLGSWQIHRAKEKSDLLAELASVRDAPPANIEDPIRTDLPIRAMASGHFASHPILLDNRVDEGRIGYEAFLPLILDRDPQKRAVLVDRGWLPQGRDRRIPPAPPAISGPVRTTGLALAPARPVFRLSERELLGTGWPLVVQALDLSRIAHRLGYPLVPVVLYPDGSRAAEAKLAAFESFPPERHIAYAVQWFGIALVLVVVYVRHGLHRSEIP